MPQSLSKPTDLNLNLSEEVGINYTDFVQFVALNIKRRLNSLEIQGSMDFEEKRTKIFELLDKIDKLACEGKLKLGTMNDNKDQITYKASVLRFFHLIYDSRFTFLILPTSFQKRYFKLPIEHEGIILHELMHFNDIWELGHS